MNQVDDDEDFKLSYYQQDKATSHWFLKHAGMTCNGFVSFPPTVFSKYNMFWEYLLEKYHVLSKTVIQGCPK